MLPLALVLGVVEPASAASGPVPAAAKSTRAVSPDAIAPLVSPPLDTRPTSTGGAAPIALPAAQPSAAARPGVGKAAGFDAATSTVVSQGESSTVFKNVDGTYSTVLSTQATRVQSSSGAWVDASTAVAATAGGGGSVANHPLAPRFAASGDSPSLVQLSRHGAQVQLSLLGARSAALARQGSQALYRGVLPGADLSYEVTAGSVKESVVLAGAPSAPVSYRWRLSGTGFTVQQGRDGEIELVADSDGAVAMTIPPAVMVDSSGKAQVSEPATANAPMSVAKDGSGWVLTITPDLGWLQAPERVYPVKIDPTVYATGNANVYSYKSDGTVLHDGYARIGNARDNGDKYWRSVFTYNYAQFFGTQVLDAQVQVGVATGTVNNYYAQTGWANAFSYNGEGTTDATTYISSSGTFSGSTLSQQYASWVASGNSGTYVYMAGYEQPGLYTYKQVVSNLVITTAQFPTAAQASPGNGATAGITPTLTGSFADPGGSPWMQMLFRVGSTSNPDSSAVYDSGWVSQSSIQVPAGRLSEGTTYYWTVYVRNAYDGTYGVSTVRGSGVWSFTTNTVSKVSQSTLTFDGAAAPGSGTATIVTTSPTISWAAAPSDPNGPVQYMVQVATGSDAVTGTVLSSGWQSGMTFAVPEGSLLDGGVYSYTVLTKDALSQGAQPWTGRFQVNRRLAESGPSPTEQVGPVTVNLANGNAGLRFTSPTVATVGGPMGLSFSYNSKASRTKGLLGRYYAAGTTPSSYAFTTQPLTTRIDPQLDFFWGSGSPSPAVPVDQFAARWTGFITVPASGAWTFGVVQDDGARVKIGTTTVLDRWSDQSGGPNWGTATTLDSSTPTAIQVDYYDNTGGASFQLLAMGPGYPNGIVVPSDWFSPTFETLPAGWTASSALAGDSATYVSASIDASAVVVTDETGTTHTYTKTSTGGYTPPPGEYGVLTLSPAGLVNLTDESGTVYVFGSNGRLESATPPADAKNPATPSQTWRAGTGQLDAVTDRASGKAIRFYYANDTSGPEGAGVAPCTTPTGFGPTPPGDVCRIVYPSASGTGVGPSTYLYYDTSGRLQRIVDPGTEVTDFQYATTGELTGIRTPLVMDWLAADSSRAASAANLVQIAYSGTTPATRKVTSVMLPAADGLTTAGQLTTSFSYTAAAGGGGTTFVDRTGVAPSGHARTVTFDATLRQLTDTTASGITSSQVWDPAKDLLYSATDGAGRMTTTIYDARDRVTDTYGPAPVACFGSDRRPLATCPITPAHTTTGYDQNLHGLNVAYYNNGGFAGQPAGFGLGLGTGGLSGSWATGVYPDTSITQPLWSARATGVVTFPAAGTYTFTASNIDDGLGVWVDDTLVLTATGGTAVSMPVTRAAAGPARIRVEYTNSGGGAGSFTLAWSGPGVTSGTIPDSALDPDYGLSTSTSVADSAPSSVPPGTPAVTSAQVPSLTTSTGYGTRPWLGQPTTSSVDPTGLNLTTTTAYETSSSGYNRRTGKWLPSATAAGLTDTAHGYSYTYYSASDTQPAVCNAPAGALPAGLVKTVTEPTPATGTPVVTSYVYDEWGRVLGTNKAGDAGWSCLTYDARGRVTQASVAAANGAPARTTNTNYAVGNNPLVSSVSDPAGTITTTIDLLGRTVTYTDVKGTSTTTTYDAAGRPSQQVSTTAAGGPTSTVTTTYLDDGRVASVAVDGTVVSTPAYDQNAELTGVTYPTLTGTPAVATPAFVQQTSTHQQNKTVVTLTPTTALTAGNRLIVQVGVWGNPAATAASVTSSTGEVFTKVLDVTASDQTQLSLWTTVVAGGAGAKPTITVTPTRSADVGAVATEYSGLSSDGTGVDLTASSTGTTTTAGTVSSGSAGPAAGTNDLAVGLYADSGFGSTLTAGSGWTQRANISGAFDMDLLFQDQVLASGASAASTTGTGANTTWTAGVVLFKPAGASTTTTTTATPAFVQQTSTHQQNKTSVQVTPTSALGTGNRLVVQVGIWASPAATAASVTDSAGDVFTEVGALTASESTEMSLWTAPITAGAGQTPTITVTSSGAADVGVVAAEYSGLQAAGTAVDVNAEATGTTSAAGTVSSGPTTATAGINELAVGLYTDSGFGDTLTAGAGYTQRANVAPNGDIELLLQDTLIPTAGSTVASTSGTGASTTWEAAVVVFKPAITTTSNPPPTGSGATSTITHDTAGQQTAISYALPGGHTLTDTVVRSQSGRILTDTTTKDTATTSTWSYTYDGAARLTQAVLGANGTVPAVTYGYAYASTSGCGDDPRAGMDGARSSSSVQVGTGTPAATTSCTDYASRLTSISSSGTATYNTRGDATSIAGQTFSYDASDRLLAGTGGTQTVNYTRDATGRIVTRVGTGTGTGVDTTSSVYSYTGDGDTPDLQLTAAGTVGERYLPLPGGVLYTKRYANPGLDAWALPNVHGDTLSTNTNTAVAIYDPFGDPLNPATGLTDQATDPTTRTGALTDAWLGASQRAAEHTAGATWTLMGARIYLPGLGQFTSTDPVEGGTDNAYAYPTDPVDAFDLTGEFAFRTFFKAAVTIVGVASAVACILATAGICAGAVIAAATLSISSDAWAAATHNEGMTWDGFARRTATTLALSWVPGVRSATGIRAIKNTGLTLSRTSRLVRSLPVVGSRTVSTFRSAWRARPVWSSLRSAAYGYGALSSVVSRLW